MQSIASASPQQINSDQSNPFRLIASDGVLRDEADVPYDGQTRAERQGRYMSGFVIVPVELRALPSSLDMGDEKKPIPRAAMTGVYVELAAYVRSNNVVWPSVKTLAEACGYSEDYVARVLAALEKCGAISKRHRDLNGMKRSNQYTLNHQKPAQDQIPPTAATIPPTAGQDTAGSGIGYRPQRQEVDTSEVEEGERKESVPQLPKAPKSRRKPETTLPADFTLTPERLTYAREKGMSERRATIQFERFCNHAAQNERKCRDWMAAWRNWVLGDIDRHGADSATDDPALSGASKAFRTGRRVF